MKIPNYELNFNIRLSVDDLVIRATSEFGEYSFSGDPNAAAIDFCKAIMNQAKREIRLYYDLCNAHCRAEFGGSVDVDEMTRKGCNTVRQMLNDLIKDAFIAKYNPAKNQMNLRDCYSLRHEFMNFHIWQLINFANAIRN